MLKRALKDARTRRRDDEQRQQTDVRPSHDGEVASDGPAEEQDERQRRQAERKAQLERRAGAERHNDALGAAVYKALAKARPDTAALKILAAVDFTPAEVDGLAALGMRYGFPGWVTEQPGRGETTKRVYLHGAELTAKTREFLEGATDAQDVVGRCLSIVVMAALADEECVARSNRAAYSLHGYRDTYGPSTRGLPWQNDTITLVEDLALERLPEPVTAPLRARRAAAQPQADESASADPAAGPIDATTDDGQAPEA